MACTLSLSLAVLAGVVACKKKEPAAENRLTPESNYDATQPVEIPGFALRVEPPGEGWKLMRDADARRLTPTAIVGGISKPTEGQEVGVFGAVLAEVSDSTLEDDVAALNRGLVVDYEMISEEYTEFRGLRAHVCEYRINSNGLPLRYRRVAFQRGGYLFSVLTWGTDGMVKPGQLSAFADAVVLTDETITGELPHEPVEYAAGASWEIREDRFEGAALAARLEPPPGWRYVLGLEAEQLGWDEDYELNMLHPRLNLHVSLQSRVHGGHPDWLVEYYSTDAVAHLGERHPMPSGELLGATLEAGWFEDVGFRQIHAVAHDDARVYHINAFYPPSTHDESVKAMEELYAALEPLDGSEQQGLRERLIERGDPARLTIGQVGYDGRVLRDFGRGVAWVRPEGLFDVNVPPLGLDGTAAPNIASVADNSLGVDMDLVTVGVRSEVDFVASHEAACDGLEQRRDANETRDARRLHRTVGTLDGHRYTVATVETDSHVVQLTAVGPESTVDADLSQALARGLAPLDTKAVSVEADGTVVDQLHRFSVARPPGDWSGGQPTFALGTSAGRRVEWNRSKGVGMALVMVGTGRIDPDNEEWMAGLLEQIMRDLLSEVDGVDKLDRGKGRLAGQPSRWMEDGSSRCEMILFGNQFLVALSVGLSKRELEAWRAGIRVLD